MTVLLVATPSFATRSKVCVPVVPRRVEYVAVPAVLSMDTVPLAGPDATSTVSESPSESDADSAIVIAFPALAVCDATEERVGAAFGEKPSG